MSSLQNARVACRCRSGWLALAVAAVMAGSATGRASAQTAPGYIWWEAENPAATNFPPAEQNPFRPFDAKQAEPLSGGKWIGVEGERAETLFLEYNVQVPKSGRYQFYARKFWQHGPFRWRFDNGAWKSVGTNEALLDDSYIRQYTGANWIHVGEVQLAPGRHRLRIELTQKTGAAAFDAFVLTTQAFTARGKLRPGQKYNRAPKGWFAFEPNADRFAPTAIDLRSLNEKRAGDGGFIRTRGEDFIHGKSGKPVRFWAVNTGFQTVQMDKASMDLMARSLAKRGVNLIRIHGGPWSAGDYRKIDPADLKQLFSFIDSMKKQGIYSVLSIYFPLWLNFDENSGFAGYKGGQKPFSLLYFNRDFQAIYRDWWRAVLTTPSPYNGGKPLRDDPAVAMVEMVNEDSNLFWTFTPQNIPAPQWELLGTQFGDWLRVKYGSVQAAFDAWGGTPMAGDNAAAGRADFMPLAEIYSKRDLRAQDTATFLTHNQMRFYQETYNYLRRGLGYKAAIYGSNWFTANAQILGPLDKYSNTVADFMDRHGYFGGQHEGPAAGYSLSVGDRYSDRSALLFEPNKPGEQPNYDLPIMDIRYNNKPSTVTEINWTTPNRYRADLPFVSAAYGLLQGTDSIFFFALGKPSWDDMLAKFGVRTPAIEGQFPAAAYMYRKGLVKSANEVVKVNLKIADIEALKGAPVTAPANLDEIRLQDIPAGKTATVEQLNSIDPLSFLVGKVSMNFTQTGGSAQIADLSRYINRNQKTVSSETRQLLWNYGRGLVTFNAPQAQGATGFLSKGAIPLGAITINSPMQYGSVALVALDNKPLKTSRKMLLQVMSEDNNYGWQTKPADNGLKEITALGAPPIVVKNFAGRVLLKRRDAAQLKVTALDFNGYPQRRLKSANFVTLQPMTMYYLLEK